ncbi:hypothetical protein B0A52_01573 [Exophiala mesophila]|uniref:Iron transport multicopper oxidase FET3 n=1 Tax=Exophiala mesophila TaxID=212818 RepID=A0A438NFD7_EXOME|nr:hypothetical protein B0A52_01573 [Exophiala mesophila]
MSYFWLLVHVAVIATSCLDIFAYASPTARSYDFDITWTVQNPDGLQPRRVISVNGQWPPPTIEATVGDRIVVNAHNGLGDRSTSLHFHGLYQNGTTHMDGAVGVSQCAIPPGSSMVYNFTIEQPGTYWYHSHEPGQYPDGLRAPLIVHDPQSPYKDRYTHELVLSVSDWYHQEVSEITKNFLSVTNPTGAEPVPQSALLNDTLDLQIPVEPNTSYFLRLVNVAAFAGQYIWVEGHSLTIIELDGIYHKPKEVEMVYLTPGQRVGAILTTKGDRSRNYAITTAMDTELFDLMPEDLKANATAYLVYDSERELDGSPTVDSFEPMDDFDLIPADEAAVLNNPSQTIVLNVSMDNLGDGINYAFFNDITYRAPKVPTLYTVLSASNDIVASPSIYGTHTNTIILEPGRVIEIVLNNNDDGKHPFHLHGHSFQVLARSEDDAGPWEGDANSTFPTAPMRRDTILLHPNGHLVLRFRSDNPGVWVFHCHIEWHVQQGLLMTFVEDPRSLSQNLVVPQGHFDMCKDAKLPSIGNAAGNSKDWLDLSGEPAPPPRLPAGFTKGGIAALMFSAMTGVLGTIVVFWYSYAETSTKQGAEEIDDSEGSDGADSPVGLDEDRELRSRNFQETDRLLDS